MKYTLKNGHSVNIRKPYITDAKAIIELVAKADLETRFLAREPGEFNTPIAREEYVIENIRNDSDQEWFVAEYDNKLVGQCSVNLVRRNKRCRHRASIGFVILKDYCNLGIGGRMMMEIIEWAKENQVSQLELNVVSNNEHALNMYKQFGFEITGTIPRALKYSDGTYSDEYYMMLDLEHTA